MKLKLKSKEVWLITVAICFVALYLFTQQVSIPNYNKINALKNEIEAKKMEHQTAFSKLKMLQGIEGAAISKGEMIKNQDELAIEIISYLSENISRLGLDLVSMKPEYQEKTVKQAKAMQFDLIVEGAYNRIYEFLKALEQSPNLLTIDSLRMTRKSNAAITSTIKLVAYY